VRDYSLEKESKERGVRRRKGVEIAGEESGRRRVDERGKVGVEEAEGGNIFLKEVFGFLVRYLSTIPGRIFGHASVNITPCRYLIASSSPILAFLGEYL
jgi:hypothetical protein